MTPAQKLAVAKMVPEVVAVSQFGSIHWSKTGLDIQPHDWLYICHCAEKKLTEEQFKAYREHLCVICMMDRGPIVATADQRAEALEGVLLNR